MYQSTHASMGQNPEQADVPSLQATRAGSSPTPSSSRCARDTYVPHNSVPPAVPTGSPPSALRPPRPGISLTEVLIAMGILTIGLLGVASIFPVASFYMQQGDVADRGSQIAQGAFNDALARGQLNPANWWAMSRSSLEPTNFGVSVDGPVDSFSRPVLKAIDEAKAAWPQGALCPRVGSVYVIDPIGAATMADPSNPTAQDLAARTFPAVASVTDLRSMYGAQWQTWLPSTATRIIWPVRRVTLRQPRPGFAGNPNFFVATQPLSIDVANKQFSSSDDLAIEVPAQADRPSSQQLQLFDVTGDGKKDALARQSAGNYSWMISVVPSDSYNLLNATCEVSTVVFYKRVLGQAGDIYDTAETERMAKASIVSTGLSGGEVLLAPVNDGTVSGLMEPVFNGLKKGRWIMLYGPSPSSTDARPQFVARWYRVLSIEEQGANRLVGLRGPQWPWEPQTGANSLSNNLCVGIFPAAVAVHSKSIRLGDSSAWTAP